MRKSELLRRLRNLRQEIELGQGALTEGQICLLIDVCRCLDLPEAERYYVVGDAQKFVSSPIPYALTPAGAFAITFGAIPPAGALAPATPLEGRDKGVGVRALPLDGGQTRLGNR